MASIRLATATIVRGPNDATKQRRGRVQQQFPLFLRAMGYLFYLSGFVICYLMVASLFDEGDAPDHHGDLHDILLNRNQQQLQQQQPPKIAYAITVTSCGAAFKQTTADPHAAVFQVAEGAAVLAHSIHRASSRSSSLGGKYDYQLIALYHPEAEPCMGVLRELGYRTIQREVFVKVDEIEGDYLREKIRSSGCCGERENIKFEAFTLTEYPLVLLLDLDCLILKPLDVLFDFMLRGIVPPPEHVQWPNLGLPNQTEFMYTLDYHMVSPHREVTPVQGGFLLIRPNLQTWQDFKDIAKKGDYRDTGGWGGKTGKFWGGQTVQGMLAYYYCILNKGNKSVELNRCVYNNMVSPARAGANAKFKCYIKQDPCQDCQIQPVTEIASTHFTDCLKPWLCQRSVANTNRSRLCRDLHHAWFTVRSEMEKGWGRPGNGPASEWADRNQFFGYCQRGGAQGYQPIQQPYGKVNSPPLS